MKTARVLYQGQVLTAMESDGQLLLANGQRVSFDAVTWLPPLSHSRHRQFHWQPGPPSLIRPIRKRIASGRNGQAAAAGAAFRLVPVWGFVPELRAHPITNSVAVKLRIHSLGTACARGLAFFTREIQVPPKSSGHSAPNVLAPFQIGFVWKS